MRTLTCGVFALLLAGCAGDAMRSGSQCTAPDRVADYRSFAWIGAPANMGEATFITPATFEQLEAAIVDALQLAGLQLAGAEAADLLVGYRVSTLEVADARLAGSSERFGWGAYDALPPIDPRYVEESRNDAPELGAAAGVNYSQARLAIEMIERATGEIVWRGWAEKEITAADRADPGTLARQAAMTVVRALPRECD